MCECVSPIKIVSTRIIWQKQRVVTGDKRDNIILTNCCSLYLPTVNKQDNTKYVYFVCIKTINYYAMT